MGTTDRRITGKQERAIAALLSARTRGEAAQAAGVTTRPRKAGQTP